MHGAHARLVWRRRDTDFPGQPDGGGTNDPNARKAAENPQEYQAARGEGAATPSPGCSTRVKRAGLPPNRLHDLWHTYGSLLMSQGGPLKTISELTGHASIK